MVKLYLRTIDRVLSSSSIFLLRWLSEIGPLYQRACLLTYLGLTDYDEGYAKGRYAFNLQTASGTSRSPASSEAPATPPAAPQPSTDVLAAGPDANPASAQSRASQSVEPNATTVARPPATGVVAGTNPYAGTALGSLEAGLRRWLCRAADHPALSPLSLDAQTVYSEGVLAGKDAARPSAPSTSAGPQPPVFMCSKTVAAGAFNHAFFRVGGSGPTNPTFELEHDEFGEHYTCGFQGWPTNDYPEDKDAADAPYVPLPSVTQSCLAANYMSYPKGRYCATGPNSNTYARWLAETCGAVGAQPPGDHVHLKYPGYLDDPPQSETAAPSLGFGVLGTVGLCGSIDCDNDSCLITD